MSKTDLLNSDKNLNSDVKFQSTSELSKTNLHNNIKKIDIDEFNMNLKEINQDILGFSQREFYNYNKQMDDELLSFFLLSQPKKNNEILIYNIDKNGNFIIPISKKILSVLEISRFYLMSVDKILDMLNCLQYRLDNYAGKQIVDSLNKLRNRHIMLSQKIGLLTVNEGIGEEQELYLHEIAMQRQLDFTTLYEYYLDLNDINEALRIIEFKNKEKKGLDVLSNVLEIPSLCDNILDYYNQFLLEANEIKIQLNQSKSYTFNSVESFYKLFLLNYHNNLSLFEYLTKEDKQFINYIAQNIANGCSIKSEEIDKLFEILINKKITVRLNTQLFKYLMLTNSLKNNEEIIKQKINKFNFI